MKFEGSSLVLGFIFSSVGLVYLSYGRKLAKPVFVICGIILMVYVYFVDSVTANILVGLALSAAPFIWKKFNP